MSILQVLAVKGEILFTWIKSIYFPRTALFDGPQQMELVLDVITNNHLDLRRLQLWKDYDYG